MFNRIAKALTNTKRSNLFTDDLAVYRRIQLEAGQPVSASAMQPNKLGAPRGRR